MKEENDNNYIEKKEEKKSDRQCKRKRMNDQ